MAVRSRMDFEFMKSMGRSERPEKVPSDIESV